MAELDFSKIFGETATSKASFTDENYLNGWGYLGSTPPPYQLFDYLQSLNDKKAKYLYDGINGSKNNLLTHNTDSSAHADIRQRFNNYLPLTGGTVTGLIVGNIKGNADTATKATQDGYGNVITGTYLKKAGDTVTGALNVPTQDTTDSSTKVANTAFVKSAHTPILNAIKAISGMSAYDTAPSKTIATMIPLLGFGGIVAQRLEDNGYVKFANTLTIQWGATSNNTSTAFDSKATLPIAFVTPLIAVGSLLNLGGIESEKNFDDKIILTSTQIAFKYFGHSYIAIGLA